MIHFYLPESLVDLKKLLTENGENTLATYHIDKIAYIIHTLYVKRFIDKRYDKSSWIELHSKNLERLLGKDYYVKILRLLISYGIIEVDKKYAKGVKCKKYRLTDVYRQQMFRLTKSHDTKFISKLESKDVFKQNKKLYNSMRIVVESLEIDVRGAIEESIRELIEEGKIGKEYKEGKVIEKLEERVREREDRNYLLMFPDPLGTPLPIDVQKINTVEGFVISEELMPYLVQISRIYHKQWNFTVDEKGHRVHTNYSNLASCLRKYVTVNGKYMSSIDLRNSQPLFFAAYVQSYFKNKNQEIPTDASTYINQCEAGTFYEYICEGLTEEKRKKFKIDFFGKVFFCKNEHMKNKMADLFKQTFPSLYKIIQDEKKIDYTQLAIKLQNVESELMVRVVCKNLLNKFPGLEILTIHDSISVPSEYIEEVQSEIRKAFIKYEISPSFKVEHYVNPNKTSVEIDPVFKTLQERLDQSISTCQKEEKVAENEDEEVIETVESIVNMKLEYYLSYMLELDHKPVHKKIMSLMFKSDLETYKWASYAQKKEILTDKYYNKKLYFGV